MNQNRRCCSRRRKMRLLGHLLLCALSFRRSYPSRLSSARQNIEQKLIEAHLCLFCDVPRHVHCARAVRAAVSKLWIDFTDMAAMRAITDIAVRNILHDHFSLIFPSFRDVTIVCSRLRKRGNRAAIFFCARAVSAFAQIFFKRSGTLLRKLGSCFFVCFA